MTGLKHRLIGRGDWVAYSALRQAHRVAGRLRRPGPAVSADGGSLAADEDPGRGASAGPTRDGGLAPERRDALAVGRLP
ncbi:hypothetical protein ONO86_00921 [Micromonospora noduli]|nr:hypothetical protein ONO86_00921 [Micromonospora noduli]